MADPTTVDRDPLVAFVRRVVDNAEIGPGGDYKIRITGELLAQTRAYLAGMDRAYAEVREHEARKWAADRAETAAPDHPENTA